MNMRVLALVPPSRFTKNVARDLVYGCWCKGKRIAGLQFPPMTLIQVATVLRNSGISVDLLDVAAENLDLEGLKNIVKKFDIVFILTSTMTINEDSWILKELKKSKPTLKTIVFGGHVTSEPESSLKKDGIDIVVRREAEYIIRDLIKEFERDSDSWKKTKGISFIDNGKLVSNPDYPLIENLDDLPIPDRSMLPKGVKYFNPVVKRMPYTTMFTSRGCPGQCIFCSSPTFSGRVMRFKSSTSVLNELRVIKELGYKEVFFRDEIFTMSKERVFEVCNALIKEKIDLTWIASARIGSVDYEMMKIIKIAGCHMLRFGVESGVQELLNNIKKGTKIEDIKKTFKWAHEIGIDTHAHMMIGLPGETKNTLDLTMNFVKEIDPTVVTFGILTPYPGTPLFNDLRNLNPDIGDGTEVDLSRLHTTSFMNESFTSLSCDDLSKYIRRVYKSFYLRPSYIFKWFGRIKSIDELKRVVRAGSQVFSFIGGGDD